MGAKASAIDFEQEAKLQESIPENGQPSTNWNTHITRLKQGLGNIEAKEFIISRTQSPVGVDAQCDRLAGEFPKLEQETLSDTNWGDIPGL